MGEPGDDLLSLEIQPTIIGAEAFHCPVRNGKEWDRHAMVTRLKGVEKQRLAGCDRVHFRFFSEVLFTVMSEKLHGYRIKLHEQLVMVS